MAADPIPAQIAAACQAVRLAGPADAVAGVQPSIVAAPASTQEASALLRAAAGLGLAVLPRGTGSRLHWGNPPERCDLVIETTRMDRVVEHAAGDLVATVQAGVSLDRLAEVLGASGQRLALDPPARELPSVAGPGAVHGTGRELDPPGDDGTGQNQVPFLTRGTVGGVLATGAAGPLRLRYGTPRDLLIGITVVRADGTVARSGGKVVKNVAGYDLGKLFAGSRGTLGLITEATFRLHPAPAATAYVTVEWAAAIECSRLLAAALESPLAPVAAELDWPAAGAPVQVGIAIEGDAAGVSERAELLADLLAREVELTGALARSAQVAGPSHAAAGAPPHAAAGVSQDPPPWWGGGPAGQQDGTVLAIAFWPGDLGLIMAEIRAAAQDAGLDPSIGGSAAGVLYAAVPDSAEAAKIAAFVTGLRAALGHGLPGQAGHRLSEVPQPLAGVGRTAYGHHRTAAGRAGGGGQPAGPGQRRAPGGPPARANVVVLHAPAAVGGLVDLFGPVPSLPLMRAVKDQFDPDHMMAPGRFAGGI